MENSPLGFIKPTASSYAPKGWAICDGSLLKITENRGLFSLIGSTYGGDGRTTFALPDLRGRVPIHCGSGPGLTQRKLGERAGSETTTLDLPLGEHTHTATFTGEPVAASSVEISIAKVVGNKPDGNSNLPAIFRSTPSATPANLYIDPSSAGPKDKLSGVTVTTGMNPKPAGRVDIAQAGSGPAYPIQANIMQPWFALNYIISIAGEMPIRP